MYDQEKSTNPEETTYYSVQDEEYGLPETEYNPLQQEEQPEAAQEPIRAKREIELQPQQSSSSWPIWVGVLVLLAVAGFSLYFFVFNKPEQAVVTPPVAIQQPEPEPEIIEEPAPVQETWTPEAPKEGSVTAITARTGRYYVVVGSFIDGDMASDYANKLAAEGQQVTLIEPTGKKKFYRLGVMGADSFAEASAELDNLKATFGQDIWVVRY